MSRPPRPREPTAISWACWTATSSASRGEPGSTCRITLTAGCSFSCMAIKSLNSSSSCRGPPRTPGASTRARTASSGTSRSSASRNANPSAARESCEPSVPVTTGPLFSLGWIHSPRTITTGPCPWQASSQATEPSRSPGTPPWPREPTTISSAVRLCSHSTSPAGLGASSGSTLVGPSMDFAYCSPPSRISSARCLARS